MFLIPLNSKKNDMIEPMTTKNNFKKKYKKDFVSIILLSYNSGQYLYEAIDSILIQDYPYIELVITDDGSREFNEFGLKKYIDSKNKNNVEYSIIHRKKNIGTVRNINRALSETEGEYIKILGGDDAYPFSNTISKQIKKLKAENTLAVVGKLCQCDSTMKPIFDARVSKSNDAIRKVLRMDYKDARKYIARKDIFPIANQATCYRREFFVKTGFCDESYFLIEDITLANRLIENSKNVSFIDEYTVNHRGKVGISTSKELFAPRRLLYYKDCITYAEKDINKHSDIFSPIYRIEQLRLSKFVYAMALAKSKNANKIQLFLIMLGYVDTMIYYIFTNTRKFINRMKERVQ